MSASSLDSHFEANTIPAGSLIRLLGLLADFLLLRDGQIRIDLDAFVAWLRTHQHADQADRIESSPALVDAIGDMLAEGHGELADRFEAIDEALLRLCEPPGAFAAIVRAARPDLALRVLRA